VKPSIGLLANLTLLLGCSFAGTASADARIMRCGDQGIVHLGDSPGKVRGECSEPTYASARVEYRRVRVRVRSEGCAGERTCVRWVESTVVVHVDDWTYDLGKNDFVQHLTFENRELVRIENGGYSKRR
jgi:hypothetical protein